MLNVYFNHTFTFTILDSIFSTPPATLYVFSPQRLAELTLLFRTRVGVDESLRGYNWRQQPVQPPIQGIELPVSEIANRYCETMRDIYLRHVRGIKPKPTPKMAEGLLYHRVMHLAVEEAKKALYGLEIIEGAALYEHLASKTRRVDDLAATTLSQTGAQPGIDEYNRILARARALWRYQALALAAAVDRERSRFPHASLDSVASRAIPQVAEYRVDGSRLGLSRQLSIDVFMPSYAVVDYKTGSEREFHRLALAGYALALESEMNVDVDAGVIVYISFDDNNLPSVKPVYHEINNEAREEFLELRDAALRIVDMGRDPGPPPSCYKYCPFREVCVK